MSTQESDNICAYISQNKKEGCDEVATTPYGYCKKHCRSVQAIKARGIWEKEQKKNTPVENTPPPPEEEETPEEEPKKVVKKKETPVKKEAPAPKPKAKKPKKKEEEPEEEHGTYLMADEAPKGYATLGNLKKMTSRKTTPPPEEQPKPKARKPAVVNSNIPKVTLAEEPVKKIIKKQIGRNKYGNFEDPETHIIFERKTHVAFAVQLPKGGVRDLDEKEKEICRRKGWKLPPEEEEDSDEESYDEEISESEDDNTDKEAEDGEESSDSSDDDSDDDDDDDDESEGDDDDDDSDDD